jgi:hypothetical protein
VVPGVVAQRPEPKVASDELLVAADLTPDHEERGLRSPLLQLAQDGLAVRPRAVVERQRRIRQTAGRAVDRPAEPDVVTDRRALGGRGREPAPVEVADRAVGDRVERLHERPGGRRRATAEQADDQHEEREDDRHGADPAANEDRAIGGRGAQWRKWRRRVKTIAIPARSAASTTSGSRTEPPGWMMAVTPASIAI